MIQKDRVNAIYTGVIPVVHPINLKTGDKVVLEKGSIVGEILEIKEQGEAVILFIKTIKKDGKVEIKEILYAGQEILQLVETVVTSNVFDRIVKFFKSIWAKIKK